MKLYLLLFGLVVSFLTDVSPWTVNLEEMKMLASDKEKSSEEKSKKEIEYDELNTDEKSELIDKSKYAKEYEYQGYQEAKVTDAILSGSRYLEGLSQALLDYRQMLEGCGDNNVTLSNNKTEQTQLPEATTTCSTVTKNGKIVQRLSELALQTAKKLKDRTYAMNKDGESEENELLLQLAWFLDHLARLTGYVPNVNDFNTTDTSQPTDNTAAVTESGRESLELLETVENGRLMSKLAPKVTDDKIVVKRSIDPLMDVAKYYTKYQLWNGSNLNTSDSNFDIDNELRIKSITKRSIPKKKYGHLRYKNVTKMSHVIRHVGKLRKRVVKMIIVKKLKN